MGLHVAAGQSPALVKPPNATQIPIHVVCRFMHDGAQSMAHMWLSVQVQERAKRGEVVVVVDDGDVVVVVIVVVVVDVPQTFGVPPPPQVSGSVHIPQSSGARVRQVPSSIMPQWAPAASHVVGVQQAPAGLLPGGELLTHSPLWPFVPQQL